MRCSFLLRISMGMAIAFYARPLEMNCLGNFGGGITYSLHALLLCDDLAGMLRCLWNGISVDDEHPALELTQSLGPKGKYLGQLPT